MCHLQLSFCHSPVAGAPNGHVFGLWACQGDECDRLERRGQNTRSTNQGQLLGGSEIAFDQSQPSHLTTVNQLSYFPVDSRVEESSLLAPAQRRDRSRSFAKIMFRLWTRSSTRSSATDLNNRAYYFYQSRECSGHSRILGKLISQFHVDRARTLPSNVTNQLAG